MIELASGCSLERPTLALKLGILCGSANIARVTKCLSVIKKQRAEFCAANSDRILQHGAKDWLELTRGARDDLQHLAGRRLLLQRFCQIIRSLPKLIQQAG